MIQLTDEKFEKFYLNETLIEMIVSAQYRGGSDIRLTTGRWVSCMEGKDKIVQMLNLIEENKCES